MVALHAQRLGGAGDRLDPTGALPRAALALVFAGFSWTTWFEHGAQGPVPLVAPGPVRDQRHAAFGVRGASLAPGVVESTAALLLPAGFLRPLAGAAGAALSLLTVLVTIPPVPSPPGIWQPDPGAPAISLVGAFLLKHAALSAASAALSRQELGRFARGGGSR